MLPLEFTQPKPHHSPLRLSTVSLNSIVSDDFAGITYIASIGLRVLLEFYQQMSKQGSMKLINVQEPVLNVLKMTGFNKFLSIS